MNELAIASIPMQPWEMPVEPEQALCQGTVFQKLRMPFFIEEKMQKKNTPPGKSSMEGLLLEIQQISFYLYDLLLYLDMHPGEQEAMKLYNQARMQRKELMKEFSDKHYPLTMDCEGLQTAAQIPWDVPGTEPVLTILPKDQCCCQKGGL